MDFLTEEENPKSGETLSENERLQIEIRMLKARK